MTENKRSVLVLGAAWALVLLGGYHLARAAYGNFSLAVMFESPAAMLSLANSTAPVELPPLARLAQDRLTDPLTAKQLFDFILAPRSRFGLIPVQDQLARPR